VEFQNHRDWNANARADHPATVRTFKNSSTLSAGTVTVTKTPVPMYRAMAQLWWQDPKRFFIYTIFEYTLVLE